MTIHTSWGKIGAVLLALAAATQVQAQIPTCTVDEGKCLPAGVPQQQSPLKLTKLSQPGMQLTDIMHALFPIF
jgi:hypothetical protein